MIHGLAVFAGSHCPTHCCSLPQGVAAAVCRHEFVLAATNLFTPECFVY